MIRVVIVALLLGVALADHNGTKVEVSKGSGNGTNGEDRIIGGYYSYYAGQFPYMASLQNRGRHTCGASIILRRWLLTAAHCVKNYAASQYTVVVGTNSIYSGTGSSYQVERFIYYPYYNYTGKVENDIALIRTRSPIAYNSNVQRIQIYGYPLGGNQPVILSGWGLTAPSGSVSTQLKYTQLTSLSESLCSAVWAPVTGPNQVCTAGTLWTGACNGDSGSPLTFSGMQVGIASFVGGNCFVLKSNVFTRVLNYIPWIVQTVY